MNVLFLDYDGVVNTPMWNDSGTHCGYAIRDKVNNFQAVQWVSELCQKYDLKIVVTSTWRFDPNYKEALINGGLRSDIEIIGRTNNLNKAGERNIRGKEIKEWLDSHKDVKKYIIIDDDRDFLKDQLPFLVKTWSDVGFTHREFAKACSLLEGL